MINIIPRRENDGMDFQWAPKQLNEEEMSTIELQIKEYTEKIAGFEEETKEPEKLDKEEEKIEAKKDDYTMKQFDRIP